MLKLIKQLSFSLIIAAAVLAFASLADTDYTINQAEAAVTGKVNSGILNIRKRKSTKAKRIKLLHQGDKVTVLSDNGKWVKVKIKTKKGYKTGYTQGRYINTAYGTASKPYANIISGKSTKSITIKKGKSNGSASLLTIKKGAKVKILTTNKKWVKIKYGNVTGYVKGRNIKTAQGRTASNVYTKGESVIAYAKKFLGNPYVYGGSSLTHGTDCSGFVMSIYRHFGKSLPHSSSAQRHVGRAVRGGVKNAKPGDIICYSGHVALYMGGNRVIHASNPSSGIKITSPAGYRHIVAIRRIF